MKIKKHIKSLAYWLIITLITMAILSAVTLVVMLLWNLLMPGIILCDKINFWQALGLIALTSILVKDKSKLWEWLYE